MLREKKRKEGEVETALPLLPPLFTVLVDARAASHAEITATLRALDDQIYRNIEVCLLTQEGLRIDPAWDALCRALRGISYMTASEQSTGGRRNWRGDFACLIAPGSKIGASCFARLVSALRNTLDLDTACRIRVQDETVLDVIGRERLEDEPFLEALFRPRGSIDLVVRPTQTIASWMDPEGTTRQEALSTSPSRLMRMFRRLRRSDPVTSEKSDGDNEDAKQWILRSGLFDGDWYLQANADVKEASMDLLYHYLTFGWKEKRSPTRWFSPSFPTLFGIDTAGKKSPLSFISQLPAAERDDLLDRMNVVARRVVGTPPFKPGVSVLGHFSSVIGLGQSARNLIYAADASRLPVSAYNVPSGANTPTDTEFHTKCARAVDRRAAIHVFDAITFMRLTHHVRSGRTDILYPFWELSRLPAGAEAFADTYDEIWAPSTFVAEAFASGCNRPVHVVPQPVRIPATTWDERDGPLRFLALLDFDSFATRKNPEGAVAAYLRAFPDPAEDVRLCVKVRGTSDRGSRPLLLEAARRDHRIEVIDRTLSRSEMDSLVMSCDAIVSLHRSEGFGFAAAEAMAAAKPVISTDYSATTDFVTPETGYPVAYEIKPLAPESYVDWKGQVWAEPDIDDAARAMREIANDWETAKAKGARGRQLMIDRFSPEAVGRQMRMMLLERDLL